MADASDFLSLNREQRLTIIGARIAELETRTPGAIDSDKLHRSEEMLWRLIENRPIPDAEWVEFCMGDKLRKYLKHVGGTTHAS